MTQPIIWTDYYRTGVDRIDIEHQSLFGYYNDLVAARSAGPAPMAAVRQAMAALDDYVASHFRNEESLMVEIGYPHYVRHKAEHKAFRADLSRLAGALSAGDDIVDDLCRFVRDWLTSHIAIRDTAIADFIADRATGPAGGDV